MKDFIKNNKIVLAIFTILLIADLSLALKTSDQTVGSTITTINGSDKISESRSTINANFANLNATKMESSTTSVSSIISLPNLSTIGTIISGIWHGSIIDVLYGGTGRSTLALNSVLVGNGTNGIKSTVAGTDGQQLTYSSSSIPYWSTPGVNQSSNYSWSGSHTFSGTTSFIGLSGGAVKSIYGDGSDGDVTISATTTLTRDMYYNNLTVNSGVTIYPNGFKIFVRNTATLNGFIRFNGNSGGAGSATTDGSPAVCSTGGPGGSAATSTATSSYSMFTNYAGVAGQAGGDCNVNTGRSGTNGINNSGFISFTGNAGAKGGLAGSQDSAPCTNASSTAGVTTLIKYLGSIIEIESLFGNTASFTADNGGAAGGCGGYHSSLSVFGSGGGGGGGNGASGGTVFLFAPTIVIGSSGGIHANGGNGGNGGNSGNAIGAGSGLKICSTGGGGGGGAGGNGGYIVISYFSLSNSGFISASGGTGGTGGTAGTATCTGISGNANGTNGNSGINGKSGTIRYINP